MMTIIIGDKIFNTATCQIRNPDGDEYWQIEFDLNEYFSFPELIKYIKHKDLKIDSITIISNLARYKFIDIKMIRSICEEGIGKLFFSSTKCERTYNISNFTNRKLIKKYELRSINNQKSN